MPVRLDIRNMDDPSSITIPSVEQEEFVKDTHMCDALKAGQIKLVKDICEQFSKNFIDVPLQTSLEECTLKMTDKKPVGVNRVQSRTHTHTHTVTHTHCDTHTVTHTM